jgi:hypothetical protein
MTVADITVTPLSDLDHRTQLRRALSPAWPRSSSPAVFPLIRSVNRRATAVDDFAVGFAARPIGAAIFGAASMAVCAICVRCRTRGRSVKSPFLGALRTKAISIENKKGVLGVYPKEVGQR